MNSVTRTYESFVAEAKAKSAENRCYAAVVAITNYRTGSTRTCVMVSKGQALKSKQVGCEFIGVHAQFFNGN